MEADVEGLIGAGRHERSADRLNYRNGYRERSLDTRLGSLQLRIPKLRQGSYFPPFLEPRKAAEKALVYRDVATLHKAYSFRDGCRGRTRSEHANPRHDALVDWIGIVILAVGSNYSVYLSAGTEAIAALYSVSSAAEHQNHVGRRRKRPQQTDRKATRESQIETAATGVD
jgi:hypothetical protein